MKKNMKIRRRALAGATAPNAGPMWKWTGRAVGAAILLSWLWVALQSELWFLLAFSAVLAATGWALRFRRDILLSVLAALVAAAVPVLIVIHAIGGHLANADAVAAVLTGHIIAAPVPTMIAWTLRPTLISRAVNSVIGSGILLLAVAPVAAFGDHGFGSAVLILALVTACFVVVRRHRRAWQQLTTTLPITAGWTDLGTRSIPSGSPNLFVGRGRAMTALTTTAEVIPQRVLHRAVHQSIDAAAAVGIPARHVQPVVIALHEDAQLGSHQVSTSRGRSTVLVASPDQIPAIQHMAPCRRFGAHRRALYAAAMLPSGKNDGPR